MSINTLEKMDQEERNAILAGLRLLQLYNDGKVTACNTTIDSDIEDLATCGGEQDALENDGIDNLCERLNTEGLSFGEVE